MSKVITRIWNHKKKVIFFGSIAAWGANYGLEKKRIHDEMHTLCLQAKAFGDSLVKPGQSVQKAVVILNNAAHKSKARKMFENYAAPIFNLAGVQTTIYSTNDTKKLREYFEHMEKTNFVIFAGGNSTVFECFQSFLKLDRAEFRETPVGILPLGYSNVVYNALTPDNSKEAIKIAHAAMNIVQGHTTATDVLEIRIGDKEEKDFAIAGVQWGPLKDVENTVPKYWYLGPLDMWYAYARAFIAGKLKETSVDVEYVNVCAGCVRCEEVVEHSEKAAQQSYVGNQTGSRSWWRGAVPLPRIGEVMAEELSESIDRSSLSTNDDCGVIHETAFVTKDLHLLSQNLFDAPSTKTSGKRSFLLTFRKEGVYSFSEQAMQRHREVHNVKKYSDAKGYEMLNVSEVRITPTETDLASYPTIEIDGHDVDVTGAVHAKLHARKLFLFCRPPNS